MKLFHGAALIAMAAVLQSSAVSQSTVSYFVRGTNARLVWEPTGPVTGSISGVPVEPVDTMNWDGVGVTALTTGEITIRADPLNDLGTVDARWIDANGLWRFHQGVFMPPGAHDSGTVLGPGVLEHFHLPAEGVATNVYLHGNTQSGPPVLPTLFCLLATWGPAAVTLNGLPYDNPFDGPAPLWLGHTMTSVGARDAVTNQVLATDGTIYDMSKGAMGAVEQKDLEVHMVFHDAPMPLTANNPPMWNANYHVIFEDVQMAIINVE